MTEWLEQVEETVELAREMCGCTACRGGYAIGARTIGAMVADVPAPSSCLAVEIFRELRELRELRGTDGEFPT